MRSRQLLLVLIVFALYGALVYTGYRIFLTALLLIGILVISSLIQLLWVRRSITVTQTLTPDTVFTGDLCNLAIKIANRSRWPIAALDLEVRQIRCDMQTHLPESAPQEAVNRLKFLAKKWFHKTHHAPHHALMRRHRVISVFGKSSLLELFPLRTEDARIYNVGISRIQIRDPFNLMRLPIRSPDGQSIPDARLHVLPRPHKRLTFDSMYRINAEGLHQSPKHSDEINSIDDLRIMQPGDSLKRIHWIVSAKQNKWMIKTFEREEQGNVMLLPDLGNEHLPERRRVRHRNAILSVTSAAIQQLLMHDLSLMLITSDQGLQVSYAERSDQLLDLLVQLSATPDRPDEPLEKQVPEGLSHMPSDATVVLVSSHPDDELTRLTREMIIAGHPVFLIYYHDPKEKAEEPDEWFRKYQATGAGLIKVTEYETAD